MNNSNQYPTDLKNLIFTDGKIISFENTEEFLKVRFRDYADSELEIIFYDVSSIETSEEMYFEVAAHMLSDQSEHRTLTFFDDENRNMFSVDFKESSVKFL